MKKHLSTNLADDGREEEFNLMNELNKLSELREVDRVTLGLVIPKIQEFIKIILKENINKTGKMLIIPLNRFDKLAGKSLVELEGGKQDGRTT